MRPPDGWPPAARAAGPEPAGGRRPPDSLGPVADPQLDADALRRDRQRYQRMLDQVEQEIEAWKERAEHLQTLIGGLDRLLALDGGGGPPAKASATARRSTTTAGTGRKAAAGMEPPAATPAAPEPVEPPSGSAADAPRGTDALRLVMEGDPSRPWSLAELIEALTARSWLPASRRPEEGVRISLKRLVERGGAVRTDDGRWRLPSAEPAESGQAAAPEEAGGSWPEADPPPNPDAPAAEASPAAEQRPPATPPRPPPVRPRPASFGRPVGGTVTEL